MADAVTTSGGGSGEPELIAGRYELRGRIGRGGMGSVFRAFDRELERDVAVKSIHGHLADDPDLVRRFVREGRALASVRHPGIIALHDLLRMPEGLYLVLELVEGEGLNELLARGALPWDRCATIGAQVCDALEAAHAAGIVHRDVKPANVLLERDGRVRVADFGIARLGQAAAATQAGTAIGTPDYWSPEQAMGKAVTPAADQYAVAAMLFEMATGRPPYQSDEGGPAAALAHVIAPVPDPRELRPGLPPDAATLIMRGLAKEPDGRFASAAAMAAALRGSVTGAPAPVEGVAPTPVPGLPETPATTGEPVSPPATPAPTPAPDTMIGSTPPPTPPAPSPTPPPPPPTPPPPEPAPPAPTPAPTPRRALGLPAWALGLIAVLVVGGVAGVLALTLGGGGDDEPEPPPEPALAAEGASEPDLTIPDDDTAGASDTITLGPTEGGIEAIEVSVQVSHRLPSELLVTLRGPSGATATLAQNRDDDEGLDLRLDESDPELRALLAEPASGDWELTLADDVALDEGTLESWSLSVETAVDAEAPGPLEANGRSAPGLAIPDDDTAFVTDVIDLDTAGTLTEIDLAVAVTHPFIGDLVVTLTAPSGREVRLWDREGGADDNLLLDLDEGDPELERLVGEEAGGGWVLGLSDRSLSDVGTLDSWELRVRSE